MSEKNIIFYDASGIQYPYETSQTDTSGKNFVQVQVVVGTWILYQEIDYNSESWGCGKYKIVKQGPVEELEFSPGSFWRAIDEVDSIVLFEHGHYAGHRQVSALKINRTTTQLSYLVSSLYRCVAKV